MQRLAHQRLIALLQLHLGVVGQFADARERRLADLAAQRADQLQLLLFRVALNLAKFKRVTRSCMCTHGLAYMYMHAFGCMHVSHSG